MNTYKKNKTCKRQEILAQLPSLQRLNVGHPDGFVDWLIGLIDGDGCFWFGRNGNKGWIFSLKITQSDYNLKLLAYLKKKLKCGSVTFGGARACQYRLTNPFLLLNYLIPLLDSSSSGFLTQSKAWDFFCFKEALVIYLDSTLSLEERNFRLQLIKEKQQNKPGSFFPDFFLQNICLNGQLKSPLLLPKGWVLGFTEAEGSFYLKNTTPSRLVHGLGWTQKNEKDLLECLRFTLKINAKVRANSKHSQVWMVESNASASIEYCIIYFEGKMKGMKAIEVRKWARSYRKYKGNYEKLRELQNQIRRAKRLD